ncbi:MAG TPA: L,D-transpeptidase family protein [Allosphingosinicella sp.]|nr:L,D-transpeptidase family protein [Allosphingosinicella sp.]
MRKLLAYVSAAALLVAGCGEVGSSGGSAGSGGGGEAKADAAQVSPEALKAAVSDERVKRFYEGRDWAPVWNDKLSQDLTAAIGDAPSHAINPESYLEKAKGGGSAAEREAGMTLAALDYAQALSTGMVDPKKIFEVYEVKAPEADVVGGLGQAVQGGDVRGWLAGLAPQDPEYKALQQAYAGYAKAAAGEQRQPVAPGASIKPGGRDPRVPGIVAALRANGYLADDAESQGGAEQASGNASAPAKQAAAPASDRYTPELAAAVKKVQDAYGIKPDGVIGNDTLEALNTGAKDRARILAVNMERRRWLERQPAQTRIDVNTAAAQLEYLRDGQPVDRRRVVVGQPEWETPPLSSPIVRLVANPPWNVPESIAEEEVRPKGAAYMAKENIVKKDGRLVQQPGPKSALGLVKFDMTNTHAIYLHDTPAKALFGTTDRHSSHGCVRVHDAIGFARLLADNQGQLDAFNKALATGKETSVSLPNQIPVRLLYHSAYVEGGKVIFRADPYGWDDKLAQAMGLPGQIRPKVATRHRTDIGP